MATAPRDPTRPTVPPYTPSQRVRGQGRIYTRGTTLWIAYYHRGKQIRESVPKVTGKNTRSAAQTLLKERMRDARTARFVGPEAERVTFDDLSALYLTDYRLNRRRSLRDAMRNVRTLGESFGLDRALGITAQRIQQYTEHRLATGVQPATVNRELAALRRMFRLAVKKQKLPSCPPIELLDEKDNVREGFMEPAEFEAVRAMLPASLVLPATFAYLSGWRKGEVATLEWRDVTLDRRGDAFIGGTIRFRIARSKTGKPAMPSPAW